MSNPSLKEQLEALSLTGRGSGNDHSARDKNHQTHARSERSDKAKHKFTPRPHKSVKTEHKQSVSKPNKTKPAWLEQAQYGVELLKAYFPDCFKENKEIKPLKVGIKQDLVKELSTFENIVIADKSCMISSLSYYVNSPNYHKSVVEGAIRIDLKGQPAGQVSAEEAKYSVDKQHNKHQKKKPQDQASDQAPEETKTNINTEQV